jgi:hypothetical protein
MAEKKTKPVWRRILLWMSGVLFALALGFAAWGETPAKPMPEALAVVQSNLQSSLANAAWLTFRPGGDLPSTGFIIYPGGRVDYRAYAPAAQAIADQGYLVVIVPMPLNLAVFRPGAATQVIAAYPQIQHWAVGGHSLGGVVAANFVFTHPAAAEGLVLWASYPAANNNLSLTNVRVLSISGTQDGLSTPAKISASVQLLPEDTAWIAIQGGNHAGFGWYGPQAGDQPASISRTDQQAQIVRATGDFLNTLR